MRARQDLVAPLARQWSRAAVHWGMWPATVMLLSQWQAAKLLGTPVPPYQSALTLAGTLMVYGADRWVERRSLSSLADRHMGWPRFDSFVVIIILSLILVALPQLHAPDLVWLCLLALAGALYLLATIGRLPRFPLLKELLGAFCFTVLVWGRFPALDYSLVLAFFALGLANFLFSSHGDRDRDADNHILSLAVSSPRLNLALARLSALGSAAAFYQLAPIRCAFPMVALALLLWPANTRASVDLTFLPLLGLPLMV